MAILVTGGAGYIGSTTAELLSSHGEEVIILDNLSRGTVNAVPQRTCFYEGNVGDKKLVAEIIERHKIEECIHFAAFGYIGESLQYPQMYHENNVVQGTNLLEIAHEKKMKRFIFSSSCAVYGEPLYIPICEEHPCVPINPYGESKRMFEKELISQNKSDHFSYVALRYFNAAGATEKHGEYPHLTSRIIPKILAVANGVQPCLEIYGGNYNTHDGTAVRDYIHVADLAQAHLAALQYLRRGGKSEIVNLGNGKGYSIMDVINTVKEVTNRDVPIKVIDKKVGEASTMVAKFAKAASLLDWTPQHQDLAEIVESSWVWYQKCLSEDKIH